MTGNNRSDEAPIRKEHGGGCSPLHFLSFNSQLKVIKVHLHGMTQELTGGLNMEVNGKGIVYIPYHV